MLPPSTPVPPTIANAMPEVFIPVLAQLRAESKSYFGISDLSFETVAVVERPFSQVLQARIVGTHNLPDAFVKRFKLREPVEVWQPLLRRRVEREYETCLQVHQALSHLPGMSAVRPIAAFPDQLIIVTEQVPGRTLSVIIEQHAPWYPASSAIGVLVRLLDRVGSWNRAFQAAMPQEGTISLDEVRRYLDVRLQAIVAVNESGFSENDRACVLEYFDSVAARVRSDELRAATIHADFCPANVLVQDGSVAVIDFDRAATGCMYLDVARMFTQLEFLKAKPKFRPAVVDRMQSALLHGFDPALTPTNPLFQLMVLQHTVCQFKKLAGRPGLLRGRAWRRYLQRRHREWLRSLSAEPAKRFARPR